MCSVLYEVTIPFPVYADVSFHGAWENKTITSDCLIFIKAEPRGGGAWLIYVKFAFLEVKIRRFLQFCGAKV